MGRGRRVIAELCRPGLPRDWLTVDDLVPSAHGRGTQSGFEASGRDAHTQACASRPNGRRGSTGRRRWSRGDQRRGGGEHGHGDSAFPRLASTVQVVPAGVVRALNRGGVPRSDPIWVGVCVALAHGDWVRTADTFDRDRGCAGWVPDRRAASVGVLSTESSIPVQTWMTVLFGLAIAVVVGAGVVRARVRPLNRIRHLWLVPAVVFVTSIGGGTCRSRQPGTVHEQRTRRVRVDR